MSIQLPKDALQKVQLGQSFAEYDLVRRDPSVFVKTPASLAATDPESTKRIYVGRRGAGKTAIAYHIERVFKRVIKIEPMVFDLIELPIKDEDFSDTRQRPFKSLVCAFERAIIGEVVREWCRLRVWKFDSATPEALRKERGLIEDCDFDTRVLNLTREILEAHQSPNPRLWLRQIKRADELCDETNTLRQNKSYEFAVLIDRLDEAWDGSQSAVLCLMALMHACVRLSAKSIPIRPYLFVRENIYRRIRELDNEFSRIETSVVFLDWTEAQLVEMVSRRLVRNLSTKPPIEDAWNYFFDTGDIDSKHEVTEFCQERPRDVLSYVAYAQELAINSGHTKITKEDFLNARERYSTSKLKDLADEFDENYHNIQLVLQLFYGLAVKYSVRAIDNFIQRLLVDPRVTEHCKNWLFEHSTTHQMIDLLYQIGFVGVGDSSSTHFKSASPDAKARTQINPSSIIWIHPAFHSALRLKDVTLNEITDDIVLQSNGILEELPEGVSFDAYQKTIQNLLDDLTTLPKGHSGSSRFEEITGEVIKLCFFRALANVQPKVRDHSGSQIRDWVASNRSNGGFWEMMRTKYKATQVVWECKNYEELTASDFHQTSYYLKGTIKVLMIVFRGNEVKASYIEHVEKAIKGTDGMILILTEKDMKTFLRQALNGKVKDDHIAEIHDRMERLLG